MRVSITTLVLSLLFFKYSISIPPSLSGFKNIDNRYYLNDTPVDGEIKIDNEVVSTILVFNDGELTTTPILLRYKNNAIAAIIGKTYEIRYSESDGKVTYAEVYLIDTDTHLFIAKDVLSVYVGKKLLFDVSGTYDLRISLFEELSGVSVTFHDT